MLDRYKGDSTMMSREVLDVHVFSFYWVRFLRINSYSHNSTVLQTCQLHAIHTIQQFFIHNEHANYDPYYKGMFYMSKLINNVLNKIQLWFTHDKCLTTHLQLCCDWRYVNCANFISTVFHTHQMWFIQVNSYLYVPTVTQICQLLY